MQGEQNKPTQVTYEFAVIRLVPSVEREEFINIGVIVFSKRKRFLAMKFHLNETRLKAFAPNAPLPLVEKNLAAWVNICKGGRAGGRIGMEDRTYRFRWITANKSSILQTSRPHPGLCSDPAVVLERLFEEFVL